MAGVVSISATTAHEDAGGGRGAAPGNSNGGPVESETGFPEPVRGRRGDAPTKSRVMAACRGGRDERDAVHDDGAMTGALMARRRQPSDRHRRWAWSRAMSGAGRIGMGS